jgi:hypothetical protein
VQPYHGRLARADDDEETETACVRPLAHLAPEMARPRTPRSNASRNLKALSCQLAILAGKRHFPDSRALSPEHAKQRLRSVRFPTRSGTILVARALTTARNGGMADTLDAAKAVFRAAASAIVPKSRRDMLVLSISAHDPSLP